MASLYVDLRKSTTHRRHCSSSAFLSPSLSLSLSPCTSRRRRRRRGRRRRRWFVPFVRWFVRCNILDRRLRRERREERRGRAVSNNRTSCPDSTNPSHRHPSFFLPFIRPSTPPLFLPSISNGEKEREREAGVTHRLWILMTRAMNSDRAKGAVNPPCFSPTLVSPIILSLSLEPTLLPPPRFSPSSPQSFSSNRSHSRAPSFARSFNNIFPPGRGCLLRIS